MASSEVGNYYVSVVPDMSKFNGAVARGGNSLLRSIGSIGIGKALGDVLSSGVNTFMNSLSRGISRVDTLNTFPRVMENVGISAEASQRAIETLSAGIDGLPTTLDAAASATQRFALQNGDVEASADMFLALNNAILAGGQSAEMQASALEQVSQAYAKGRPDMMEWRTMTMTMGPALQMVAQSWGMSVDEMGEALRSGDRSMDDFLQTIQTLNTEGIGDFASLSEQASVSTETIGTALANVGSRMSAVWAAILDAIGTGDIADIINGLSSSFKSFGVDVLAPIAGQIADVFRGIADAASGIDFSWLVEGIQPLVDAFAEFTSGEGDAFAGMWERISSIVDGTHESFTDLSNAWAHVSEAFGPFVETIAPVVVEVFAHLAGYVAQVIPVLASLGAIVLDVTAGIMNFVTMIGEQIPKIPGYFQSALSTVQSLFNTLVQFVQSIPSRIVGFFQGIGARISSAIGNIHFPTPHVSWETLSIAGMDTPIKLPHVSWYAAGGLVNGAQLIGVGERGTELVWPSYGNALNKYADAIAARMPTGAGANVTNVYLDGLIVNDDARIRADVMQLINDLGRYGSMNRG